MGDDRLPRPSLFLTCRLAQYVQKVRHRLQQRVQIKRKGTNPYGASYKRGLRLRAFSDLQRYAAFLYILSTVDTDDDRITVPRQAQTVETTFPVKDAAHDRWVDSLLRDLDHNTHLKVYSLTKIAANDNLLLSHSEDTLVETIAQNVTLRHAAYLFDLSTLLLNRVDSIRAKGSLYSENGLEYEPEYKRLKDEIFIANLVHLLRRLQYMLYQALIRRSIQALDECAHHWYEHWLLRQKADDGWFAEWPDSQPPFSSTMPWNIKPSLVVLWGVCWMFYMHPPGSGTEQENVPAQPVLGGADLWNWERGAMDNNQGTAAPAPPFLSRDSSWPDASGGNFPYASSLPQQPESITTSNVWPHTQGEPFFALPTSSSIPNLTVSPVSAPPTTQSLFDPNSTDLNYPNRNLSLPVEFYQGYDFSSTMGGGGGEDIGYPSPHSVKNEAEPDFFDRRMSLTSQSSGIPPMSTAAVPQDLQFNSTSPSSEGSRQKLSIKREEPPRNDDGMLVCAHPDCQRDPPLFRRSCEWNKHMDKHERPYKCPDPACDKIQGFTYSGGLLRHQREVHKKNVATKKLLYCPIANCNRHVGQGHGFTRRENLNEHMRRRHATGSTSLAGVEVEVPSPDIRQTLQFTQQESPTQAFANKKRKRHLREEEEEDEEDVEAEISAVKSEERASSSSSVLTEKLARSERENRRKDEQIRQLEERVRNLLAALHGVRQQQQGLGMT
ncbi:MAG: hypothetical protein Q9227_003804 [Pyrenula ochraceoflavens]